MDAVKATPTQTARFVLVVDDDPLIASLVSRILMSCGREVRICGDADSAFATMEAADEAPGLVVTDVTMPGRLDGIDLAEYVNRRHPRTPVVLMSGDAGSLARGERTTCVATLTKPFTIEEVRQVVKRALDTPITIEPFAVLTGEAGGTARGR